MGKDGGHFIKGKISAQPHWFYAKDLHHFFFLGAEGLLAATRQSGSREGD